MSRFERDLVGAARPRGPAALEADGVPAHARRGRRWERTSRGLYVPAGVPRSAAQRILAAAALMPQDAVIGGWAAAHVHGVDLLDGLDRQRVELPVDVLLPPGLHRLHVPGFRYRRVTLAPEDVTVVGDLAVTSLLRTAVDLACCASSVVEATVALDLLLGAGLTTAALRSASPRGRRGAVQAREAIALARCGARSPGETRLRLLYVHEVGGPPTVLLNPTLLDAAGRFVAIPDLFDEEAGLALEYDGGSWDSEREHGHRDADQHREDNVREEAMERLGAIVVRAGGADLGPFRRQTVHRLRRARADGLERDRGRDRWIIRRNPGDR